MPVIKNAHQTQLPETPFWRTMSVTKFGVSALNVVATMEIPNSHQGIFRPDKKNSFELEPAFLDTRRPMIKKKTKNKAIIPQSIKDSCILNEKLNGLIRTFYQIRTEKIEKLFNSKLWI